VSARAKVLAYAQKHGSVRWSDFGGRMPQSTYCRVTIELRSSGKLRAEVTESGHHVYYPAHAGVAPAGPIGGLFDPLWWCVE